MNENITVFDFKSYTYLEQENKGTRHSSVNKLRKVKITLAVLIIMLQVWQVYTQFMNKN